VPHRGERRDDVVGADEDDVGVGAQGLRDDLGADAPGIADGDGETGSRA